MGVPGLVLWGLEWTVRRGASVSLSWDGEMPGVARQGLALEE